MNDRATHELTQHVPRMYRVALRVVADADLAHDIVQEACVKALAGGARFEGRSSMATWLHRITVNCAHDALRSDARRQRVQTQLLDRSQGSQWLDEGDGPESLAENRELGHLAMQLLGGLPEECRAAFELTQLDGYTYDEAAEIEGQPRGTIASRVWRAKKLLLEEMSVRVDGRARQ